MSDSRKRISDDIEEYVSLCAHFNEKVQYYEWEAPNRTWIEPDCYGNHAYELKQRIRSK